MTASLSMEKIRFDSPTVPNKKISCEYEREL